MTHFYHPPVKLQEGDVFTSVCHSVHGVGMPGCRFLLGVGMPGRRSLRGGGCAGMPGHRSLDKWGYKNNKAIVVIFIVRHQSVSFSLKDLFTQQLHKG